MNPTEKLAYIWLTKELGKKNIKFQRANTPDFIATDDSYGYEVKRLYGHSIWLYESQFEKMKTMKNCAILVWEDGNSSPLMHIPIDIVENGKMIDNVLIHIVPDQRSLKVSEEAWKAVKCFAAEHNWTIQSFTEAALREKIQKEMKNQ